RLGYQDIFDLEVAVDNRVSMAVICGARVTKHEGRERHPMSAGQHHNFQIIFSGTYMIHKGTSSHHSQSINVQIQSTTYLVLRRSGEQTCGHVSPSAFHVK